MAKEPRPGRVKTRLARDIGRVEATWWFRHQIARLVRNVSLPARWQTVLAVAPDSALFSRSLPSTRPRMCQGQGDLGARMARVFRQAPTGMTLIIGGDIPDITANSINRAFSALQGNDAVFGPAPDGGYWLIGLRNRTVARNGFLTSVRWSSPHALADSIQSLGPNARIARTSTLQDVDCRGDLAQVGHSGFPIRAYMRD